MPIITNLIVAAILPYLSDFSARLDLPVKQPIEANQVVHFGTADPGAVEGWVVLRNGYEFWFDRGYVTGFGCPDCYEHLQDPDLVPKFYGEFHMTQDEAIAMARKAIRGLGYSEEVLYADMEPEVDPIIKLKGHTIPRYMIHWKSPQRGIVSVEFEINGETKRLVYMMIYSRALTRPIPKLADGTVGRDPDSSLNDAQKEELLKKTLPLTGDVAQRMGLPVPMIYPTNVLSFRVRQLRNVFYEYLAMDNQYRFTFLDQRAVGFSKPDSFFDPDRVVKIREFIGEEKLSQRQAIKIASEALAQFDPKFTHERNPTKVIRPFVPKKTKVPRCVFRWEGNYDKKETAGADVEIDLKDGSVKMILLRF